MWQLLVFVFIGVVSSVSALVLPNSVSAESSEWLTNSVAKLAEVPGEGLTEDDKNCGGTLGVISVKGTAGYKEACIFGESEGVRLARYKNEEDMFSYAVAFPTDGAFIRVEGLCAGLTWCGYGQAGDVLLMEVPSGESEHNYAIVKNFTKYLNRVSKHYEFNSSASYAYLKAGEQAILSDSLAISSNGRWGIIASSQFGLIRIDFEQISYKRIASRDSLSHLYGRLRLSVSHDGQWAVAIGGGAIQSIYNVTDTCGETLTQTSTGFFPVGHEACKFSQVNFNSLVTGYAAASNPRFSKNSQRLILHVQTNTKSLVVTLTSKPIGTGTPYYIAFGDSFTSGEGELSDSFYIHPTNTQANRCHVSSRSYPYLLSGQWDVLSSSLACSGSRIPNVRDASRTFQDSSGGIWPTVVSVGVGGNDVDLIGKLKNCIGVGTCDLAKDGNRALAGYEIKELFPRMVGLINDLKLDFSPASLFVVGYPSVINDIHDANCSLLIDTLLSAQERQYVSEAIKYVNKILQAAASYTKTPYVDLETAYFGERLCDEKEDAMNGVRSGDDIAPIPVLGNFKFIGAESFHPTPRGHQLSAQRIQAQLDSKLFWNTFGCNGCQFNETDILAGSYWEVAEGDGESVLRQLAHTFLGPDGISNLSKVVFNFLANTFAPNSTVRFELHSDIRQLGTHTVNSDGSLSGSFSLPNEIAGYHTVHAYGTSRSGDEIDLYQTVYIGEESLYISDVEPETPSLVSNEVTNKNRDETAVMKISHRAVNENSSTSGVLPRSTIGSVLTSKESAQSLTARKNSPIELYVVLLIALGVVLLVAAKLLVKRKN